jgi:putative transposase
MGGAECWLPVTPSRVWRSVKWEEVYLKDDQTVAVALSGLDRYFHFYNHEQPHQALGYQTPAQVYGVASRVATPFAPLTYLRSHAVLTSGSASSSPS